MRPCECELPVAKGATANKPNDDERCVKCGLWISPDWTSNNATMAEYYDRLEEGLFPLGILRAYPPGRKLAEFREFRLHAESRELAGRHRFGHKMLARDNVREAEEEATDLSNYLFFELLKQRRAGNQMEWELALEGSRAAYEAYTFALALRHHTHLPIS